MHTSVVRLILLSTALAACSGGKSGGTTAPPPVAPPTPTVTSVTVSPGSVLLTSLGGTRAFAADIRLSNGTSGSQAVTWTSADPAIATVSSTGTVTAVARGQTTITASVGVLQGSATVVVATPQTIAITPVTTTLTSLGQTATLVSEVRLSNGDVSTLPVTFSSSLPTVAIVSGNVVTAVANGQTVITASVGTISSTATVTVQQVIASVTLGPADTVVKGPFRLRAAALDARNNPVIGATLQYTSLAPTVNAVDQAGVSTPQSTGVARIRLTAGGISATSVLRTVWNVTQLSTLFPLFEFTAPAGQRRVYSDVSQSHADARAAVVGPVWSYLETVFPTSGSVSTDLYFTSWPTIWTEFNPFCGGQLFTNQVAWQSCGVPNRTHFLIPESAGNDFASITRFLAAQFFLASHTESALFPWLSEGYTQWLGGGSIRGANVNGKEAPVAVADFKSGDAGRLLAPLDTLMRLPSARFFENLPQRTPVAVRMAQGVMLVSYLAKEHPNALPALFARIRATPGAAISNDAVIQELLTRTGLTAAQLEAAYLAHARSL
jgi:hypothetical protein